MDVRETTMSYTPDQPPNSPDQPDQPPSRLGQPPNPIDSDSKTWSMLVHLSTLIGGFIGPLVILLIKKGQMPWVEEHAKEALNFQISILIYMLVSLVLSCFFIGIPLLIAIPIFSLVVTIMATVKANEGGMYRYPLKIPFIK
jgi:uncharacterized protein